MSIDELIIELLTPASQVALIIALAEVCKKIGVEPKWIPLVDLFLGLLSGVFVYGVMLDKGIANGVLVGIALGLGACGLFSGIKNLFELRKGVTENDS